MAGKSNLLAPQGTRSPDADTGATSNRTPVNGQDPNIQNGNTTPGEVLKSIGFEPEPNPMSELLQPTYHFSFYLDTDNEPEQGKGNEFIIAETGVTGMNLQDVTIESFVGPNIRTRNATATSITIKIFEPFGSQLPDLLFQAAVKMNIRNYLKAPWFLKLKLHGYDESGVKQEVGDKWIWKLVLIDIKTQITENGSVHTISAMPQNEVALNNQYCMLQTIVNTSGTTVGEVLRNVVASMNEHVNRTYGSTNPPVVEYAIEDEPYPYDTMVGVSRPFDHRLVADLPQDSNLRATVGFGTQTTQFAPGTDLPAVLDLLMARTDTAIMAARVSREKPSASGPDMETTVRDPSSLMHRIDTKVEYTGYNAIVGDYTKKITFIVKPYQSLRLLTSMGRAMSFDKEKTLNKVKAKHAVEKALMKKQYDYIFTGLNTEIEKFDINVNFRWAVSVPVIQGWGTNTGTSMRVDNSNAASAKEHQLELSSLNQQYQSAQAARLQLGNEPTEDQTVSAERQRLDAELATMKQRLDVLSVVAGQESDIANRQADAEAARRPPPPTGRYYFGEDDVYANSQSDGSGNAREGYGGAGNNGISVMPITILQNPEDGSGTQFGSATDNNPNKSVYGSLLNQLYGSFDGNLQNLELTIRGDPYWLGPGNPGIPYTEPSTGTTPNFMNGEHIFVFRFKLPQGFSDTTGTVSLPKDEGSTPGGAKDSGETAKAIAGANSNIFTGFYAATTVVHSFREGYFSQTLTGVRIQGWTYENIIEGREITVADPTQYSNTPAPIPPAGSGRPSGTGTSRTPGNVAGTNLDERTLLALTLVGEAGGEGQQGMQAVGNVIMNRARQNIRGNTVSEVIMSPRQFSVWNNVNPSTRLAAINSASAGSAVARQYQQAYDLAGNLLSGRASDITGGATSYHARYVNPPWADPSKRTVVIGQHIFYKGIR
jgi:spore germination cell wall hydrolase CwlJ-like protein